MHRNMPIYKSPTALVYFHIFILLLSIAAYSFAYVSITNLNPKPFKFFGWAGLAYEWFIYLRCLISLEQVALSWILTKRLLKRRDEITFFESEFHKIIYKETEKEFIESLYNKKLLPKSSSFFFIITLLIGIFISYRFIMIAILDLIRLLISNYFRAKLYPAILYLASSDSNHYNIRMNLYTVSHVRIVSLLNERNDAKSEKLRLLGGDLRINYFEKDQLAEDWMWRTTVKVLMRFVFVIIIDARKTSEFVTEEAIMAIGPKNWYKAVFIVNSDNQEADTLDNNPIIRSLLQHTSLEDLFDDEIPELYNISLTSEKNIENIVEHIVWMRDIPGNDRPTHVIVEEVIGTS